MQFDWWTFAFQVVNVAVLIWLLSRFMFRPVARIIAERQAETGRILAEADAARKKAAKAEEAAAAEARKNADARAGILEAARAEAQAERKAMLERAREDAAAIAHSARRTAATLADEERKAQLGSAVDLAVVIARRLLDTLPGDARLAGYTDGLKTALAALDAEHREALCAAGDSLRLVAPRPLTEAEIDEATQAVRSVIPTAPTLAVDLDETLIAGLELRGQGGRNPQFAPPRSGAHHARIGKPCPDLTPHPPARMRWTALPGSSAVSASARKPRHWAG